MGDGEQQLSDAERQFSPGSLSCAERCGMEGRCPKPIWAMGSVTDFRGRPTGQFLVVTDA